MKAVVGIFSLLVISACIPVSSSTANESSNSGHEECAGGVESLSPGLRKLLSREMMEIQKGMMSVIPAYASGDWRKIEGIGSRIQGSYILKQSITNEQVEELRASLPDGFIELDKEFHYMAGMLSHAAGNKNPELVGFYFSRMAELCVRCHRRFATHKFGGFGEGEGAAGGHAH